MFLIYTDGASNLRHRLKVGGIGISAYNQFKEVFSLSKGYMLTTNNRMEIRAVLEGIKWYDSLNTKQGLQVFSDSKYVVDMWNRWLGLWLRRPKKDLKNVDLVNQMLDLKNKHPDLELTWVKGHNGDIGNERADLLAKAGMESPNRELDSQKQEAFAFSRDKRVDIGNLVKCLFD